MMTHSVKGLFYACVALAWMMAIPSLTFSQAAQDDSELTFEEAVPNDMVILTPGQEETYFNAFWYKYATWGKKDMASKAAPHFPHPDSTLTGQACGTAYQLAVDNWITSYPEEVIAFEKVFHPDMIFRHKKSASTGPRN